MIPRREVLVLDTSILRLYVDRRWRLLSLRRYATLSQRHSRWRGCLIAPRLIPCVDDHNLLGLE